MQQTQQHETTRSPPHVAQSECSRTRYICTVIIFGTQHFSISIENKTQIQYNREKRNDDNKLHTACGLLPVLLLYGLVLQMSTVRATLLKCAEVLSKVSIIKKLLKTLPPEVNRMPGEIYCVLVCVC